MLQLIDGNNDMTMNDDAGQHSKYKEIIFGDGSFDDCVRIASMIDGSYVLDENQLDQLQVEEALESSLIPQTVVEYVASCETTDLITVMLRNRLLSNVFAAQYLRKQLMSNEVPSEPHRSLISNSQFLNGTKQFLKYFLRTHKIFERSGYASSRFSHSSSVQNTLYNRNGIIEDKERIWWAEQLNVDADILEELSVSSVELLEILKKCSGFETEPAVLAHLFFNKNLTIDDVSVLVEEMPLSCGGDVWEIRQLLLFIAVLLRDDWTADELRFLYQAWLKFVEKVEEGLGSLETNSAPVLEFISASQLLRDFQALVPEVNILVATNETAPVDVLMNVFGNGDKNTRAAVVRNPGVGRDFAQAVLFNDVNMVSDMCSTRVLENDVHELREHAAWNSSLPFDVLSNLYEDEKESVEVRFSALFNTNIPSFIRLLYC